LHDSDIIKVFKGSHGYNDGEQRRDFIHVSDTVKVKNWFMNNSDISGIFNVGTGMSRSFNDIANCVLKYFDRGKIEYVDFPDSLEEQYQAFTEAKMEKIRECGYNENFLSLEEGVNSYLDWLLK
jgi:ADP-L-glycero-D-manno-heptose 6-epimerase